MVVDRLLRWLRTADSPVPHRVRTVRRTVARLQARRSHGSVTQFLDDTAAAAALDRAGLHGGLGAAREVDPSVAGAHPTGHPVLSGRSSRPCHRIVALSTYPLHPRQTGGQLRAWHLARALTREHDVEVVAVAVTTEPSRSGRHDIAPGFTEYSVALPQSHIDAETRMRLVSGVASITDIAVGLMWGAIPELVDRLERSLDGAAAAVLVQPYLEPALAGLGGGIGYVCDEHNDEVDLKRGILPDTEGGRWLMAHVEEIDARAIAGASLVAATTDSDLEVLTERHHLTAPTAIVPNGVDTSEIEFVSGGDRKRRRLAVDQTVGTRAGHPTALFVGSGHRPNIEAGRAIIAAAAGMPDIDFVLAGRHSASLRRRHIPSNVHLLGLVDDDTLDLLLAGCDLALNPMEAGSGSNLKLLTYLAAGLPVVSTLVGARGVDAEEAGLVTTELHGLTEGVASLLSSSTVERAATGRRYVEEHCDWAAIGLRYEAIVREYLLP